MRLGALVQLPLPLLLLAGCVTAGVTHFGESRPPLPDDCPMQMFPSGPPPYLYEDLASARVTCYASPGRAACLEDLHRLACRAGADTVYGLAESVTADGVTHISALFARRKQDEGPRPETRPETMMVEVDRAGRTVRSY